MPSQPSGAVIEHMLSAPQQAPGAVRTQMSSGSHRLSRPRNRPSHVTFVALMHWLSPRQHEPGTGCAHGLGPQVVPAPWKLASHRRSSSTWHVPLL